MELIFQPTSLLIIIVQSLAALFLIHLFFPNFDFVFWFSKGIAAISYIVEEKAVKMGGNNSDSQASLLCVLFWTSLSQFLAVVLLFWADIIPGFGHTNNVHEFIQK